MIRSLIGWSGFACFVVATYTGGYSDTNYDEWNNTVGALGFVLIVIRAAIFVLDDE